MSAVRGRCWWRATMLATLAITMLALGLGLTGANAQGPASVAIVDFAFEPGEVTIALGETVTWTNTGAEAHTVTADSSDFTSGPLAPGDRFRRRFDTAGVFSYRCRIHPSMMGEVIVVGGGKGQPAGAGAGTELAMTMPNVGVGAPLSPPLGGLAPLAGVAAVLLGAIALMLRTSAPRP